MSIPLVQNNEKDSINTSIIAIKRNIERINMLLGLVDNDSPDLSGFATKQELQDAVTELQPVDEVTVGNMQSVTSNAVASAVPNIISSTLSQIFLNCKMNVEFVKNTEFGGNGFLFHLYDSKDWEYTQVMIAPISNDYSIWYPVTYIFIRVRDYATGNWQGWRQI